MAAWKATRARPGVGALGLTLLLAFSICHTASVLGQGRTKMTGQELGAFCPGVWSSLLPSKFLDKLGVENNCNPTDSDPVDTTVGEYLRRTVDRNLRGPLPLGFARYSGSFAGLSASMQGAFGQADSPMGNNWVHNHLILMNKAGANVVGFHYYQAYALGFTKTNGVWSQNVSSTLYRGNRYQLVETGAKLNLLDPERNLVYIFDTTGASQTGSVKRGVETISDRNGNSLSFSYNFDGTLNRVVDGLGRSLDFSYTSGAAQPRISMVIDQSGRAVQFGYTGALLSSFTDARGKTTSYAYDAGGRIAAVTRPAGNTPIRNSYNTDGSMLTQADGTGNTTAFSYASASTTITDPLGATATHNFNAAKRFTSHTDPAGKSIQYEYDSLQRRTKTTDRMGDGSGVTYDAASGKVTSRTDNDGNVWKYSYTAQAQDGFTFYDMTRIDCPDGTHEEFAYDTKGNVVSRKDQAGKIWSFTYSPQGQLLTVTNPAAGVATLTYNGDGTVASGQDPAGNITTYGYDALKRLNQVNNPDGTSVHYSYDANDNLVSHTDEKSHVTSYTYDDNNNRKTRTDPRGGTWTYVYDANDRRISVTDPLGKSLTFTYDALQRVKTATDRTGNTATYNYDSRGRLTAVVDPEGKTWATAYDDEGIVTARTNPLGQVRQYGSDKEGRIRSSSDPLANQDSFAYDALGRLTAWTNPLAETRSYGYDSRGLLNQVSLPGPISGSYSRNDLGLVTQITDPRQKSRAYAYDSSGRLSSQTDPLGNATHAIYDQRNRIQRTNLPLGALDLGYDSAGLPVSLSYSDGTRIDFSYDAANRLTAATGVALGYDNDDRIIATNGIDLSRDNEGRISSMTLASGKTVSYGYDKRGLLTAVSDWGGRTTQFTYDAAGRLLTMTRPNGVVTTYRYDAAGRVTSIIEKKDLTTLSSIVLVKDGAGQTKEAAREVPQPPAVAPGTSAKSYNDADQIVGFTYDTMGRLAADGARSFTWDLASRLTSYREGQNTASFTYDAFGNRLTRSHGGPTRSYVWNYGLGLPSVSIVKDNDTPVRYFIHAPAGSLLFSIDAASGDHRYYHYDELGSTIFLTDDGGAMTDSYAYTAYGQPAGTTGATDNPFTYIGKYGVMREGATGLYYMRARYYDSAAGRFLSSDPLSVQLADPKSTNPYQYAAGNPLQYIDPLGEDPADVSYSGQLSDSGELVNGTTSMRFQIRGSVPIRICARGGSGITSMMFQFSGSCVSDRRQRDAIEAGDRSFKAGATGLVFDNDLPRIPVPINFRQAAIKNRGVLTEFTAGGHALFSVGADHLPGFPEISQRLRVADPNGLPRRPFETFIQIIDGTTSFNGTSSDLKLRLLTMQEWIERVPTELATDTAEWVQQVLGH